MYVPPLLSLLTRVGPSRLGSWGEWLDELAAGAFAAVGSLRLERASKERRNVDLLHFLLSQVGAVEKGLDMLFSLV